MLNDELKTKKEPHYIKHHVVLAMPLSFIQTSRCFEEFLVATQRMDVRLRRVMSYEC